MLAVIVFASLLTRMAAINPSLHTYTAQLRADVHLLSFPFLQTQIVGTLYRREPDREKLVITSGLPALAQQFDELYPQIVAPSQWEREYVVRETDAGAQTRFALVPRKHGNVDRIDAVVDNATALVESIRWTYANGGWAEMQQRYASIDGNELAVSQRGHVEEPGYVADIDATLDDYRVNVALPAGVFDESTQQ